MLNDLDEAARIGQVAVMEQKMTAVCVRIFVDMIDPARVEGGGAPLDSMHLISLRKQQLSQIGSILSGNTRNQRSFHNSAPGRSRPGCHITGADAALDVF
jgi:hypothetical protein